MLWIVSDWLVSWFNLTLDGHPFILYTNKTRIQYLLLPMIILQCHVCRNVFFDDNLKTATQFRFFSKKWRELLEQFLWSVPKTNNNISVTRWGYCYTFLKWKVTPRILFFSKKSETDKLQRGGSNSRHNQWQIQTSRRKVHTFLLKEKSFVMIYSTFLLSESGKSTCPLGPGRVWFFTPFFSKRV